MKLTGIEKKAFINDDFDIIGTAEVQMIMDSVPVRPSGIALWSKVVISQTMTRSRQFTDFINFRPLLSVLTKAIGSKRESVIKASKTSFPVLPAAPVTKTFDGVGDDEYLRSEAVDELLRAQVD